MPTSRRFALLLLLVLTCVVPSHGQTRASARVMRDKLAHSQHLLEAIVTSDFAALERHSADLARLTRSEEWLVFKSPEYARQTADFTRAIEDLRVAAERRDVDAAAVQYATVTLTCVQCHRHVKDSRLARP
jgi:hypothetical protein